MREKSTKLSLSCAAFLFLCMLACVVGVASAKTIYVPDDYERIQWAVDSASAGDTIIVRDGIYYENVNVNKQLTLKSENGSANCIVDAGGSGSPITLNADGISIEGFTVRNSGSGPNAGIKVYSSDNRITGNNISNNGGGIDLWLYSSNNRITDNNISNNVHGIFLMDSSNNSIYLNNFIDNSDNVCSYDSANIWNSTEEITYTYNGKTYTNYLGNYWSDYTGSDADGDGIGDTPYIIDGDKDNYPLMERFEHYFVPTPVQIFDTGRPENPYPSISGEFVGTIKANRKIIAKKLYTYACEGTGGHTEHALIWNETWCAEAKWKGYKGDWMNISFNKTVILMPYETYNITLVTGSYPQIHHTSSLKTENGWINCTEFIDANGKKYENWIPAIKLWFAV